MVTLTQFECSVASVYALVCMCVFVFDFRLGAEDEDEESDENEESDGKQCSLLSVFDTVCVLFVNEEWHEYSVLHSSVCVCVFDFRLAHEPFVIVSRGRRRGERRGGVKGRDETVCQHDES